MPVASNILRLARLLHGLTGALIVILPVLVLWFIARDVAAPGALAARYPDLLITPTRGAVVLAGIAGFLPLAATLYALSEMRGLFARYRQGEILTLACAERVQGIGQGLFALAALGPVAHLIQVLILTWNNPPGERALVLAFDQGVVGFLLSGALMILIGRVMREAARVAEENAGFV